MIFSYHVMKLHAQLRSMLCIFSSNQKLQASMVKQNSVSDLNRPLNRHENPLNDGFSQPPFWAWSSDSSTLSTAWLLWTFLDITLGYLGLVSVSHVRFKHPNWYMILLTVWLMQHFSFHWLPGVFLLAFASTSCSTCFLRSGFLVANLYCIRLHLYKLDWDNVTRPWSKQSALFDLHCACYCRKSTEQRTMAIGYQFEYQHNVPWPNSMGTWCRGMSF